MKRKPITLEDVYEGIEKLHEKLDKLIALLSDEGELSDEALAALEKARKAPPSDYIRIA